MAQPQEPRQEPGEPAGRPEVFEVVEETIVVSGGRPVAEGATGWTSGRSGFVDEAGYREWDRSQWVGEGQEPPEGPVAPPPAETEPRWEKWEWVGEGQGRPGPRRGLPAAAMPDGDNAYSGNRHNPGMAHWGGSRLGRQPAQWEEPADAVPAAAPPTPSPR